MIFRSHASTCTPTCVYEFANKAQISSARLQCVDICKAVGHELMGPYMRSVYKRSCMCSSHAQLVRGALRWLGNTVLVLQRKVRGCCVWCVLRSEWRGFHVGYASLDLKGKCTGGVQCTHFQCPIASNWPTYTPHTVLSHCTTVKQIFILTLPPS